MKDKGITSGDAGVDIDAGDALVERIKPLARRTARPEVLAGIGGFGGPFGVTGGGGRPALAGGGARGGTKRKVAVPAGRTTTQGAALSAPREHRTAVCG